VSRLTLDIYGCSEGPARGDLLVSVVRGKWHRTWFVLGSRRVKPVKGVPRYKVWMERWWQIEPELRIRLWHSAMRRDRGQQVIEFTRYPAKKRLVNFEQLMGAR
jgi:hypothetical protein